MSTYDHDALRKELIRHEGYRESPYEDSVGVLTIGVGHNLQAKPMCWAALMVQLEHDIRDCIEDLDRNHPIWRRQTDKRQRVLINMCFNLGIAGLGKFRNMWTAIDAEDYDQAAVEMLDSRWAVQVGSRSQELAAWMRGG
jgi:lysozyme